MKRSELINAAKELNEVLDCDPAINTKGTPEELQDGIFEASKLITEEDELTPATKSIVSAIQATGKSDDEAEEGETEDDDEAEEGETEDDDEAEEKPKSSAKKSDKKAPAKGKKVDKPKTTGRKPSKYGDNLKVTILAKENPKRGDSATRFKIYKTGMTIGEFIKKGGTRGDVAWDVAHKYISVK